MPRKRKGVSLLERLEAILRNPAVYEMAARIPRQETRGGRPRHYPTFMWLVFEALLSVFESARQVEAELAHPLVWQFVRDTVAEIFPEDLAMHLPSGPMQRHHYQYARNRYLCDETILEELRAVHREEAGKQSVELGLMNPQGPGSWTHPHLDRMLYADGKVVAPLYRRGSPGDSPRRTEPDAALHAEGTGEFAWGVKFVLVAARTEETHGRMILDIEWVPRAGAEAAAAMRCFRRLQPHLPGVQGVVYDTALRGVHHQELLRELGWIPVNRVAAAHVSRSKKPGRRVEKTAFIEMKKLTTSAGEVDIGLYAKGGAVTIGEYDERGDMHLVELKRLKTHRAADKQGRFRWYTECALPDRFEGKTVVVRLDATEADRARGFNRTENVRVIPPSDPDFATLFRRRNDAESINRALDDSMYLGRAHSVGHTRQTVNLLGYAIAVNSLAVHRHRLRIAAVA